MPSQPGLRFVSARVRRLLLSLQTVDSGFLSLWNRKKRLDIDVSLLLGLQFASMCLIAYISHVLTWPSVIAGVCLSGRYHCADLPVCKPWCLSSCFNNGCMYTILWTFVFLFQIPNLHPAISTFLCFVWRKEKIWLVLPAEPDAVAVGPLCNTDKELRTKRMSQHSNGFLRCLEVVDRAYSPDFKTIIVMGT